MATIVMPTTYHVFLDALIDLRSTPSVWTEDEKEEKAPSVAWTLLKMKLHLLCPTKMSVSHVH